MRNEGSEKYFDMVKGKDNSAQRRERKEFGKTVASREEGVSNCGREGLGREGGISNRGVFQTKLRRRARRDPADLGSRAAVGDPADLGSRAAVGDPADLGSRAAVGDPADLDSRAAVEDPADLDSRAAAVLGERSKLEIAGEVIWRARAPPPPRRRRRAA